MLSLAFPLALVLLPLPFALIWVLPPARGQDPALIAPEAALS